MNEFCGHLSNLSNGMLHGLQQPSCQKRGGALYLRNQVVNATAIPGMARLSFGRDIIDALQLPDYRWPKFAVDAA
jgi:hypothetical protein